MGKMKEKGGHVYFTHHFGDGMGITYGVGVPDRSVAQFGTLAEAKKYCIGYYQSNIRDAQGDIWSIKSLKKKDLVKEYLEGLKSLSDNEEELEGDLDGEIDEEDYE